MKNTLDQFQSDTTFTMSTETQQITRSKISSASPSLIIEDTTLAGQKQTESGLANHAELAESLSPSQSLDESKRNTDGDIKTNVAHATTSDGLGAQLYLGDCKEILKNLPSNSVDAVVSDPPYGIKFMGRGWDYDVPSVDIWREVFRVLKPGGHVLSFGGTRTYHRMVVNIEDAGFEIRDQVQWIYGSGFPKSHNVSKAIDKMAGAEREVVGVKKSPDGRDYSIENAALKGEFGGENAFKQSGMNIEKLILTAPATPDAKTWDGWGSALKPANEPICLARKPLEKGLTLAENVLKYGTGALNIDGTRIGFDPSYGAGGGNKTGSGKGPDRGEKRLNGAGKVLAQHAKGRFPANVLFDEDAAALLGEPSRFFYVAKASKRERNAGLEGMPDVTSRQGMGGKRPVDDDGNDRDRFSVTQKNHHPTVKPIKLMEYLITLITPSNGTVLDPFMGSGSTGVAAKNLNRNFIGIEMNEEYFAIAEKRIENVKHI